MGRNNNRITSAVSVTIQKKDFFGTVLLLLHSGDYNTVDLIHKAKMNGISYEVSAKNHFELAEKSKRYFKRKIYILSNSQGIISI